MLVLPCVSASFHLHSTLFSSFHYVAGERRQLLFINPTAVVMLLCYYFTTCTGKGRGKELKAWKGRLYGYLNAEDATNGQSARLIGGGGSIFICAFHFLIL
jgi:hypothetical protein